MGQVVAGFEMHRLEAIRARIRHSIEDPRPGLTVEQAKAELARFMDAEAEASDSYPPRSGKE